jgi:hypothetical protein
MPERGRSAASSAARRARLAGEEARSLPAVAMRVALYARVSTRDRDQDPELQLQPMREYAVVRGWRAGEYVDQASAADMAGRRGWAQLLEDVRRRRVDHVMAWKLDRPGSLNNLSVRLGEMGRREDGVAAIEEAAALYRRLAEANPAAYEPDLASSLNFPGGPPPDVMLLMC